MSETKRHDPMCPLGAKDTTYQSWGFVECRCDEYAKVRADERAKRPSIFDVVQSTCGHRWVGSADEGVACPVCEDSGVMTRRTVADLRAKVEGLPAGSLLSPHAPACPGRPGYRGICNCERLPRQYLWRSDVLALLKEERDRG